MTISPRLRAGIMLILTAVLLIGGYISVEKTPFDDSLKPNPETDNTRDRTILKFSEQSAQFSHWAFALLAGVIALIVTTKGHRTLHAVWLYCLLGPTGAALLMSLRAGWQFQRRLTNLTALNNFADLPSLAVLLMIQWRLFLIALTIAALFALWYLYHIVIGNIDPFE